MTRVARWPPSVAAPLADAVHGMRTPRTGFTRLFGRARAWIKARRQELAAFVPVAALLVGLWTYKVVVEPRPFWAAFTDLELDYFFASLHAALGHGIEHGQHPGTPVILVGVPIALLTGSTVASIATFLVAGKAVVLVANVAALWLLAREHRHLAIPGLAAVVAVPFAFPPALGYLDYFGANSFLVAAGIVALIAVGRMLGAFGPHRTQEAATLAEPSARGLLFAGGACGLAVAVQVQYVPLALAVMGGLAVLYARAPAASLAGARETRLPIRCCIVVAALLCAYAVAIFAGLFPPPSRTTPSLGVAAAGIAVAVGVAVFLRRARAVDRLHGAVASVATFVGGLVGGFVLATVVAWPAYPRMVNVIGSGFLPRPALHAGSTSMNSVELILHNLAAMPARAPFWAAAVLVSVLLLVLWVARSRPSLGKAAPGRVAFAWTLLFLVALAGLGGLKQGPIDNESTAAVDLRNFVPVAVACAFALGVALDGVAFAQPDQARLPKLAGVALVLLAASAPAAAWMDAKDHVEVRDGIVGVRDALDRWFDEVGDPDRELVTIYGQTPRPSQALRTGGWYVRRVYDPDIDALYPREGYFHTAGDPNSFHVPVGATGWDLKVLLRADVAPEHVVLVRGAERSLCNEGPVEVVDIRGGPYFVVHRDPTTLGGREDACLGPPFPSTPPSA